MDLNIHNRMDNRASKPKPDILFDPATVALREIMMIARKRSLLSPPEFSHLTNAYISERPSGTQLGWLAEKLGIQPGNLQADLCNGMGWPVWSVEHFKNAKNERSGFITVIADHGLVAPTVLSACRRQKLDYLFCFAAVVAIDELEALLAGRHE